MPTALKIPRSYQHLVLVLWSFTTLIVQPGNAVNVKSEHFQIVPTESSQILPNFLTQTNNKREPRFLTSLFNSESMNCAPQVMCELITANEPGPRTDTLNDYKYLIKEFFLKSSKEEDDDEDNNKQQLRSTNDMKSKQTIKKKKKKDKNGSGSSSSSEEDDSVSLSSQELEIKSIIKKKNDKTNGIAELMELEEEDAIENKAIDEMVVNTDPDDFIFAMADARKKHKLQEIAANRLDFQRNLKILQKTLTDNKKPNIFRTSRSLQDEIVQRKARELKQTNNILDRVRIAAEIGSTTRSARQCRALFDSCSMNNQGVQGLVDGLRNRISGSGTNKNNRNSDGEMNVKNVAALLQEVQSWNNAKNSPDVKVVLNIGGPPTQQSIIPVTTQETLMTNNNVYQPADMLKYWSSQQTTILPPIPTSTKKIHSSTTLNPIIKINKKINSTSTSRHPAWPKLIKNNNKSRRTEPESSEEDDDDDISQKTKKDEYRLKLQEASKILRKIHSELPKNLNFTHSSRVSMLKSPNSNNNRKRLISSDSDSESLESSEEKEEDILPMQTYPINQGMRTQFQIQNQPHLKKVLASVPLTDHRDDSRKRVHSSTWVSKVYDVFFKSSKVLPLPDNRNEWLPSAQRHSSRRSYFPIPLQRFVTKPVQHEYARMPTTKQFIMTEQNVNSKPSSTKINTKNGKRRLKYKNCCSDKSINQHGKG